MSKRILIVEDDAALAEVLRDNLVIDGFDVCVGRHGDAAVALARTRQPDLILLDLMLPEHSGFDLLPLLRTGNRTPVIIISAKSQKVDKLRGLEIGADDYVTKPFDIEELVARIHAVLRRSSMDLADMQIGDTLVDFRSLRATRSGMDVHLTHREFEVLQYLAARRDRVVKRDELLRAIWGFLDPPTTRSVDHAVARLRKKMEPDPHNPKYIRTVHGDGYCLTIDPGSQPRTAQG